MYENLLAFIKKYEKSKIWKISLKNSITLVTITQKPLLSFSSLPEEKQYTVFFFRLVTLYFAHEKKSSSAGTLRNALPTRHDVWDNTLNHENSGGGGVGSDDTAVIMDVMQV